MNIEDKLVDSSRNLIDFVVAEIGDNHDLYYETLRIAFQGKEKISPRAARVITFIVEKYPHLGKMHIGEIVHNIIENKNTSVNQNLLKVFTFNILPEDDEGLGLLANYCFSRLMDKEELPAITVYAMETLYLIALKEPDLIPELIAVIEDRIPYGSAGIKNRGNRILKKLHEARR